MHGQTHVSFQAMGCSLLSSFRALFYQRMVLKLYAYTVWARNDLDTTSIGLTVLTHIETQTKHEVMDEMLRFRNKDGIVQVYFDHSRPRIGLSAYAPDMGMA
jgi:hypothetical protein